MCPGRVALAWCPPPARQAITGLSYHGDFRMVLGENPHKVANIVLANQHHFGTLYAPVLEVRCWQWCALARPTPAESFSGSCRGVGKRGAQIKRWVAAGCGEGAVSVASTLPSTAPHSTAA